MRSLIVTIPLQLATQIIIGNKKVEFRKRPPKQEVSRLLVCVAGSGGHIIAETMITAIRAMHPSDAWKLYGGIAGVTEELFLAYVSERQSIICIELAQPKRTDKHLSQFGIKYAPQNFVYTDL